MSSLDSFPTTGERRTAWSVAVREAFDKARQTLLARRADGHWSGCLSSSALATATAAVAFHTLDQAEGGKAPDRAALTRGGLLWLAAHQNADGGWGDTPDSPSNLSTTALGWAACGLGRGDEDVRHADDRARRWLEQAGGGLEPSALAAAIGARYGKDRTFSAPILLVCALTGRLGADGWRFVPQLPYELAACPREWFEWLRLPVVSYALPALIAIGHARHGQRPSRNPVARLVRRLAHGRTLEVMGQIQPPSGGFLEAVPLTAFVVMSLVAGGQRHHPTVARGADFLARSMRPDGSWPIDTNLATWTTTLAVNALAHEDPSRALPADDRRELRRWLLDQQHRQVHSYTQAAPGGWAWTDLSGGVPDADDTAGALLALRHLGPLDEQTIEAARAAASWLLRLQNADGGIPTFCRGWTNLPFDRSGPDLTAHALRAWAEWRDDFPDLGPVLERAASRAVSYLARTQQRDGSWVPLWFGNQAAPGDESPTYGTSRVVVALRQAAPLVDRAVSDPLAEAGSNWLLAAQNGDGSWGGAAATAPSIEETSLAVAALAAGPERDDEAAAIDRGLAWLLDATHGGRVFPAAPIGLYFAKLWYSEQLYPLIFAVGALGSAVAAPRTGPRRGANSSRSESPNGNPASGASV